MIKYFINPTSNPDIDLRLERRTSGAAGFDLMASIGTPRVLEPGRRWAVSTGLFLELPVDVGGEVRSRSGLARDHGVVVLNSPGTIDSDYRGEVCVMLINHGEQPYRILPGERVAQLVFCPVYTGRYINARDHEIVRVMSLSDLESTARGASGHGSTGR